MAKSELQPQVPVVHRARHLSEARLTELGALHERIDNCRVCERFVQPLIKPTRLERGTPGRVLVLGEAPAAKEFQQRRAFAGNSGTRLNNWFLACGQPPDDPRRGIYLTSVLKCARSSDQSYDAMVRSCRGFLDAQIDIIRPRLVITLGSRAYDALRVDERSFARVVCTLVRPTDVPRLFPTVSFPLDMLVWPHPSGRSRWLNDPVNAAKLEATFGTVRSYLES